MMTAENKFPDFNIQADPSLSAPEQAVQLLEQAKKLNTDPNLAQIFNTVSKALEQYESQVIALEEKLAEAQQLQELDALTSVKNRRGFNSELNRALKDELRLRVNTTGIPAKGVVLLMIDMDRFKPINDTYGHNAGDNALIKMTEVVQNMIRPLDTLARLGGDEFAVILPHTSAKEVHTLIANISSRISELELPWEGKTIRFGGTLVSHECSLNKSALENYTDADQRLTRRKDEKRRQPPANSNIPHQPQANLG